MAWFSEIFPNSARKSASNKVVLSTSDLSLFQSRREQLSPSTKVAFARAATACILSPLIHLSHVHSVFPPQRFRHVQIRHMSLTHTDALGKAQMVDVSGKETTCRSAVASAKVRLGSEAFTLVENNQIKKGDVLAVANTAGVMAAKSCANLIPLCHSIMLSSVKMRFVLEPEDASVNISATVKTSGPTGVEMEALTAVSVAALTVYDMCKAVSHDITIDQIRLEFKEGGQSGKYERGN